MALSLGGTTAASIPGPPGPAGPEGPAGPVGPAGPAGPGSGLPANVLNFSTSGTPSHPQTTIFTSPETALYRVGLYLVVTTVGSAGDMWAKLFWMDKAVIGREIQSATIPLNTKSATHLTATIQMEVGTQLTYETFIFNNATGARIWELFITVEKLSGATP